MNKPKHTPGTTFHEELTALLNRHSVENDSDTPDFILAVYITECLQAFAKATGRRDEWHGWITTPKAIKHVGRGSQ